MSVNKLGDWTVGLVGFPKFN